MAWYDTGTVSVTNGSTAVTGSGTNFVAGAQVGEGFYGPDGRLYEIQAIVSATSLTLADAYLGATQTGQEYKIVPTQSLVADLASQVSTLISDYQSVADNAGEGKFQDGSATSPGITFTLDQDTGFFRDTANKIGVAVAGAKKAEFNSSGLVVTGSVTADGLTVDTNTLYVDSTNNRVAIGTTSPAQPLTIQAATPIIQLVDSNLSTRVANIGGENGNVTIDIDPAQTAAASFFSVNVDNSERMRVDQFGNVGIGTASPSAPLDVVGSPGTLAEFRDGVAANFIIETSGAVTTIGNQAGSSQLAFKSSNSEAMRIDASGNLLVAGTSATLGSGGIQLNASGRIGAAASSLSPMVLNRTTTDGGIIDLRKDGTTVGSIGTRSDDIYLASGNFGIRVRSVDSSVIPTNGTGSTAADGTLTLGNSANRFNDLYLAGGVYLGGTVSNNYLDDYEHGIYTVTITPATSGTVTLDTVEDSGTYVKIGNLVHVSGKIEVASVSSPVGTALISLPFAVANVNENSGRISGSVAVQNIAFTGAYLTVFALEGNSHFQLQQVVSNSTWVALDSSALGTGDDIQFTFTYRTTD